MSVITDCPYICAPNIMGTPDYTTKTVTLDMTDQTVIKAGTPISADGKVANDETAIGVLLNDCHACLGARRGLVVISGRVKQDVAAEHSGITISDEAKSAMINLTFTGDGARGGGGEIPTKTSQLENDSGFLTEHQSLDAKADKNNPVFTGSLSVHKDPYARIGQNSLAFGQSCTASGVYSVAVGDQSKATGSSSHAEGKACSASGEASHAEGQQTSASGINSHSEGCFSTAGGNYAHAEGFQTGAHGNFSHAEGNLCKTQRYCQHVQGECNILDTEGTQMARGKYAHIVGNGTSDSDRSNAHTLDWNGVPWFQGRPQFGGTAQDDGSQTVVANGDKEIILTSSTADSTKRFRITVDDSGTLSATEVTE